MKNKSSKYKIQYAMISLLCVVSTFIIKPTSPDSGYRLLALVGLIELISFEFFSTKCNGGRLSFASLFVPILYVFHFGQVLLLGLFADQLDSVRIVLTYFSEEESFVGNRIMNLSFALICFGILCKAGYYTMPEVRVDNDSELKFYIKTGKQIITFLFPIKVLIDAIFIYKSFTIGFLPSTDWLSSFPDVIKTMGELSLIGFALLIIGYKNDKSCQRKVILFILLYYLLLMTSGRRSENVAYICGFIFLFIRTCTSKIRLKTVILGALGGLFLLVILTTVRNLRDDSRSAAVIAQGFTESLYNPALLIDVLREFGDTGYTALCVLFLWLPKFSPSFGASYLLGLSAILPNIGGLMGELSTQSAFGIAMQEKGTLFSEYYNIGGSIIGELYFNFGITGGVIASLFLGLFIGYFFDKVEKALYTSDYFKVVTYFLIICSITYWIRDSFVGGIRIAVWSVLLCSILFGKRKRLQNV